MRKIISLIESFENYSTIDKFWLNVRTNKFIEVEFDHYDEIDPELDATQIPFDFHWVRGGFSSFTNSYHLEAKNKDDLRKAILWLMKNYTDEFSNLYYDISESNENGVLDIKSTRNFIRTNSLN